MKNEVIGTRLLTRLLAGVSDLAVVSPTQIVPSLTSIAARVGEACIVAIYPATLSLFHIRSVLAALADA